MSTIASDGNAERSVVAAAIQTKTARDAARKHITAEDFLDPHLRDLWKVMARLDRERTAVDGSTLMSAVSGDPSLMRLLPDLVTMPAIADNVGDYARVVRGWAIKRRLYNEASETLRTSLNPDASADQLAAKVTNAFAAIRDSGNTEDVRALTLGELLSQEDDEPDWLIPGLLERRDRLMLTGEEGLGKSYLLRQIAIMAAAGLHPFDHSLRIDPIRVLIFDCENSLGQVRRKARGVSAFSRHYGSTTPDQTVFVRTSTRIDLTRDRDLASIHREMDATQPDLVVIGPLYRLYSKAIQSDEEAAPLLAALDTLRDRGAALLIEAHAGHAIGKGGVRDLRPRGSSALLGWPELGYGMRSVAGGYADLVPWRGDRDARFVPERIRHCNEGVRWLPVDGAWHPTRPAA